MGVVAVRDTYVAISKQTVSIADRITVAVTASTAPVTNISPSSSSLAGGEPLYLTVGVDRAVQRQAAVGVHDLAGDPVQLEDTDELPLSLGTGVMADIARHLEAAYRSLDLELLGSLLHPDVRWSGECSTSAELTPAFELELSGSDR